MEQLNDCSKYTSFSTSSETGQKLVIMLDGNSRNRGFVRTNFQTPMVEVSIPPSRISSTSISVRKTMRKIPTPSKNYAIKKQETVSGNRTTHIQKSTHRVEQLSSRIHMQQLQQQKNCLMTSNNKREQVSQVPEKSHLTSLDDQDPDTDEDYSEDGFDPSDYDFKFLKLVKKLLRSYIEEVPSRKLKSGEYTWTEIRPYIREFHYPKFKKYLQDREIRAPNEMIFKCLKDIHISRRDLWLKKQRKLRDLRNKEQLDNSEIQSPRLDGYGAFEPKVVIYNTGYDYV